ncbi:hypothetical protein I5Q34_23415 [Streptomyces sp. AV19]|uniref:hypothetical protein n=1 Tax=Streptomyces sp. AV19 TaxID=2793068 RepID=UPI0018FE6550|nr:hypothetical protein [Streptomyces sp. AV19]MBH1937182.1 hypothetical protein [Streptomyces sp. AV19]MDG4536954.1 hypothetical protein [Streptomyces sp. AV19]
MEKWNSTFGHQCPAQERIQSNLQEDHASPDVTKTVACPVGHSPSCSALKMLHLAAVESICEMAKNMKLKISLFEANCRKREGVFFNDKLHIMAAGVVGNEPVSHFTKPRKIDKSATNSAPLRFEGEEAVLFYGDIPETGHVNLELTAWDWDLGEQWGQGEYDKARDAITQTIKDAVLAIPALVTIPAVAAVPALAAIPGLGAIELSAIPALGKLTHDVYSVYKAVAEGNAAFDANPDAIAAVVAAAGTAGVKPAGPNAIAALVDAAKTACAKLTDADSDAIANVVDAVKTVGAKLTDAGTAANPDLIISAVENLNRALKDANIDTGANVEHFIGIAKDLNDALKGDKKAQKTLAATVAAAVSYQVSKRIESDKKDLLGRHSISIPLTGNLEDYDRVYRWDFKSPSHRSWVQDRYSSWDYSVAYDIRLVD